MAKMVMVVNNQPHNVFFAGTKLRPGVNSVSEKVAKDMAKNSHVKKLIGIGHGRGMEIAKEAPSTKELDLDKAKELVEKTNDKGLLSKYESEDDRPAVAKAIVEKKEEIGPTEEKK